MEEDCAGRISRRLLEQSWRAGSFCEAGVYRATTPVCGGLAWRFRLHAGICRKTAGSGVTGLAIARLWLERPAKAGNLRVTLSNETDVTAVFTREDSRTSPLQLHVALLGSKLESDVERGENSGRKLRHDFVVLQLAKTDLIASGDRWIGSISIPKQNAEKPRAFAAWVSEEDVDS